MRVLATLFALVTASSAAAHEFWLEPNDYVVSGDAMLQGQLVNGEEFQGTEIAYLPRQFVRFLMYNGIQEAPVENRLGARPALDTAPLGDGLHILRYESNLGRLTYSDWEKFLRFAAHKDFADIEARHDARGLPRTDFAEGYWRFAKSLIAVGDGAGEDRRTGLAVEYVALDNPYTDDVSNGLRVQLFVLAEPGANRQVELFEKAPDGSVTVSLLRTDENGIATLPVRPGHSYLVDHVDLRIPPAERAEGADIVWETLWASLTFAVPE